MNRLLGCVLVSFAIPVAVWAQGTATISGVVNDPSGAVVPMASVKITNAATGWNRTVLTDSDGRYFASPLPVGPYVLEVEFRGFSKLTRKGVQLTADSNAQVDLTLELGETNRSITVSADAALVEVNKSTQVTLVDAARMRDLPLNGRNALDLQQLQPGVVSHGFNNSGENSALSINGARGTQNNYTLDGGESQDNHNQVASVMPNPDALQEFSIMQFANSAEYGRGAGAQVNVVTKSGTNNWHGSAFDFLRNDYLNARGYFAPSRSIYRKNQFGGTVGGPVLKNRTFFFFSYQGTRQRIQATQTVKYLPSDLERQGEFASAPQKPIDPQTGQRFPNDRIPSDRFDPASVKFVSLFLPKTPQAVGAPFYYNYPSSDGADQYLGRMDHTFSDEDRISGRVFWNDHGLFEPQSGGLPGFVKANGFTTRNLMVNETHLFRANLVNDFRYTFHRRNETGWPTSGYSLADLGVQLYFPKDTRGYKPWIYMDTGDFGVRDMRPGVELNDMHQVADSLLWVRGAHVMKFGFDARRTITDDFLAAFNTGYFSFTNAFTKVNFADFLLGMPQTFQQDTPRTQRGHGTEYSFFAQDDFKVSRRLTLNLGIRWDPFLPPQDLDGHFTYFNAGSQSTVFKNAPPGLLFQGDAGVPSGAFRSDWNNVAPRVGFAWDVNGNGKTSVRAGYGIFYTAITTQAAESQSGTQPFSLLVRLNAPGSFVNPWGASGISNPFPYTPSTGSGQFPFTYPLTSYVFSPDFRMGYIQQWDLLVERQLWTNMLFRAAYVGSKGTKLWWDRDANAAVFIPGQSTAGNINSRRPLAPYFAQLDVSESRGTSNYNSLQLTLIRRFSQGITFQGSYSWSKSIDLNSSDRSQQSLPYPGCPECNRGRSDFDVAHVLVASWVWELPFLRARDGVVGLALGGWRLSGIATARSGLVFSVLPGSATSLSGTGGERANVIGDPSLAGGGTLAKWFNTAAFVAAPAGSWGNAGRNILEGPGAVNVDLALNKDFRIFETHTLNARLEAFNAANHTRFGTPNATVSSSSFGRILSSADPRIVQVALRYAF